MSKKLRAIVLAVVGLVTVAAAQNAAEPYAFQSDRLGMTWSEWMTEHGYTPETTSFKGVCKPATPQQPRQRCVNTAPRMNVAGCEVDSIAYSFYNDRLYEIVVLLPERCFERIRGAFRTTYGPPLGTTPQHVEAAGNKLLQGTIVIWMNGVSEIQLAQFDDGPDQSSIYFLHSDYGSAAAKYIKERNLKR